MRKETVCRSSIGNHIKGFLEEKWSLGYKYMHEANIMRIFDEYWANHNYCDAGLTHDNLADWVKMGENEGPARLLERITVIRQFAYTSMGFAFPVTYRQSKQSMRFLFGFHWPNMKSRNSFHR